MKFDDFRKALEERTPLENRRDSRFDSYARDLYESGGGRELSAEHADAYFRALDLSVKHGRYCMSSEFGEVLAGCVRKGTIVTKPYVRKR